MLEPVLYSSRVFSPLGEESGDEELSVIVSISLRLRLASPLYRRSIQATNSVNSSATDNIDENGEIVSSLLLTTLSASDLRDPETSALIAAKLREFHTLKMPGSKNVILWDKMRHGPGKKLISYSILVPAFIFVLL